MCHDERLLCGYKISICCAGKQTPFLVRHPGIAELSAVLQQVSGASLSDNRKRDLCKTSPFAQFLLSKVSKKEGIIDGYWLLRVLRKDPG
jgi:hypothetical protein